MKYTFTTLLFFAVLSATSQKSMRVTLTENGVLQDEVLTQYGVNFSNAHKFNNYFENLAIVRNSQYWSVERRSELVVADTTFLILYGKRKSVYTFKFSPNLPSVNVIFHYKEKEYGLSNTDTVTLTIPLDSEDTSRFTITYNIQGAKPLTYPNPVNSDTFTVNGLASGTYMFRIFDQNGKYVYARSQDITGGKAALSAKLKKGVYYVTIQKSGMQQQIISLVKY